MCYGYRTFLGHASVGLGYKTMWKAGYACASHAELPEAFSDKNFERILRYFRVTFFLFRNCTTNTAKKTVPTLLLHFYRRFFLVNLQQNPHKKSDRKCKLKGQHQDIYVDLFFREIFFPL